MYKNKTIISIVISLLLTISFSGCNDIESGDTNINQRPIANAGEDIYLFSDQNITITADGFDGDGDTINYTWVVGNCDATTVINNNNITVSLDTDIDANCSIQLYATDGNELQAVQLVGGNSQVDTVSIYFKALGTNTRPMAQAVPERSKVATGSVINVNGLNSYDDDNDDIVSYIWNHLTGEYSTIIDNNRANHSFVAKTAGYHNIQLIVSDGWELSAGQTIVVEAIDNYLNELPTLVVNGTREIILGEDISLDTIGSMDADGDALSFGWHIIDTVQGSSIHIGDSVNGEILLLTPDIIGTYLIEVIAEDGKEVVKERIDINVIN